MIYHNGQCWFIRERNDNFYLVDDQTPDLELKLHAGCMREAERIAWLLLNDQAA